MVPRVETGDLVAYFGRGPVQLGIRTGAVLSALLHKQPVPPWAEIPSHVEVACVELGGAEFLYGARAGVGFVRLPVRFRLAGLREGRDYRIVHLGLKEFERDLRDAMHALEGTPYPEIRHVASVWRDGAPDDGTKTEYCSESVLTVWQKGGVPWSAGLSPANFDPTECLRLGMGNAKG